MRGLRPALEPGGERQHNRNSRRDRRMRLGDDRCRRVVTSHQRSGSRQIWYAHVSARSSGLLIRSDGFSNDTTVYGGTPCVSHTLEPITA